MMSKGTAVGSTFESLQGVSKIVDRGVIYYDFKRRSKFKNTCRFLNRRVLKAFQWPKNKSEATTDTKIVFKKERIKKDLPRAGPQF